MIEKESEIEQLSKFYSHLTYIVECIASDCPGEAKLELGILVRKLEKSEIVEKDEALTKLKQAVQLYKEGNYRHAAICTVTANRLLQKNLPSPLDF